MTKENLQHFKNALLIAQTGKDAEGNQYETIGQLNQAAWIGEHAHILINEIERLQKHEAMLDQVREWLARGATIRAAKSPPEILSPEGIGGVVVSYRK